MACQISSDAVSVVGDAEIIEFLQQLAAMRIVLDHAVGIDPQSGLALAFFLEVRNDVCKRRVNSAAPAGRIVQRGFKG